MKSGNETSIIDYVLVNKRNGTDVMDVRIRTGAEICSEYFATPERETQDND